MLMKTVWSTNSALQNLQLARELINLILLSTDKEWSKAQLNHLLDIGFVDLMDVSFFIFFASPILSTYIYVLYVADGNFPLPPGVSHRL